jgi:hypothetical protein
VTTVRSADHAVALWAELESRLGASCSLGRTLPIVHVPKPGPCSVCEAKVDPIRNLLDVDGAWICPECERTWPTKEVGDVVELVRRMSSMDDARLALLDLKLVFDRLDVWDRRTLIGYVLLPEVPGERRTRTVARWLRQVYRAAPRRRTRRAIYQQVAAARIAAELDMEERGMLRFE